MDEKRDDQGDLIEHSHESYEHPDGPTGEPQGSDNPFPQTDGTPATPSEHTKEEADKSAERRLANTPDEDKA